jgi:trimeric autotransporter adhesin
MLPAASSAERAVAAMPSGTFFVDGTVLTVAAAPDRVYVGGDFSLIGAPTGSWVAISPEGTPVAGRPSVAGAVTASVQDGRGGWFIAGAIDAVGSTERSARVVHLRANGELDRGWRVAVGGGRVDALALRGTTLFLGGTFKSVAGKARRALAAVGARRGQLLPWRLRGEPRLVEKGKPAGAGSIATLAFAGDGRTLYLSGFFGQIGGRRRAGLAAVRLGTGLATPWNPAPNGSVEVIRPRGSVVFVGGDFTQIGGARRNAVAALDATTGRSRSFDAHAAQYASVSDLVVGRAALYIAGDFNSLGGRSRHLLGAVDLRTGSITPWEPSVTGDDVTAIALDAARNTVYFAGDLAEVGGQRRDGLAAVDARTGAVTGWDPRALGEIAILAIGAGGTVFAGGEIAFVGGARRHGLASISSGAALTDWDPNLEGIVRALALHPDKSRLYVGGAFAPGDARTQRNLAVVDTATGALHAFGGGTNSGVWTIAPSADGSTLYVGGAFVTVAGKRRTRLASLDSATGALLPWNSGANDLVRIVLPADDALYVGGDFASAGGLARPRLVKLDLDTGAALGWNPEPDDTVWALELRNETLYVGGEFAQIGGRTRNALAALDVESGDASSWDPNADATVRALRLSPDRTRLYAAGEFTKVGSARRGYAEFSLPQGSLTGWSPAAAFDGYALAFTPDGSLLVIGGEGGVDLFR